MPAPPAPPPQPPKRAPLAPGPDHVTAEAGSRAFRALNFELYAKPVGFVRHLSLAGTAVAAGVLVYFWAQGQQQEAAARDRSPRASVERRV